MKNYKINRKQSINPTLKAKRSFVFLCTLIATFFCINTTIAQTWSGQGAGTYLDRWTINDDNSNHWSQLRLQVGTAHSWNMVNQGTFLWFGYGTNSNHGDAGVNKMALTNDAKLGLGIVPTESLHIKGSGNPVIFLEPNEWDSVGDYGEIRFGDTNHYIRGEYSVGMKFYDVDGFNFSTGGLNQMTLANNGNFGLGMLDPQIDLAIGDNDTGISQNGDGELGVYTNNVERIRIDNSGNVGVGTIDPTSKLHVSGDIRVQGDVNLEHNKSLKSEGFINIQADNDNSGDGVIVFKAAHEIRMTMLDNGNFGIGIASPTDKLHVNGTIRALSIVSSAASFPDYVFADDYEILPLNEVEVYVKKNKHLPNMPAEAEIVENGLNVSDILTRSVENIETLYLHLIELKKEIQLLKEDNASLKSELRRSKK
ncbi:hypothetical protein [Kordia sp.]|uniref:hypothetical protein n=1 Tax=Kordia sp. TaxID=1965332 RepID=UPI003D2DB154